MNKLITIVTLLLASCAGAYAQTAPSASAGGADLRYSLRYSQTAQMSGTLKNQHTITPSGSLSYTNGRANLPFTMSYTGGYTWGLTDTAYSTGFFQHFTLSQGFAGRGWDINVGDDVSYRPQAPITGYSGIAGTGEPIGGSGSNPPSSQSILTIDTHVLNNNAQGHVQRILNHATLLNLGANYDALIYPDGNGIDTNSLMSDGGLNFRVNARNSITARYLFSQYSYPDRNTAIQTQSTMVGFERIWNRSFRSNASVGPEWINSSYHEGATSPQGVNIPSSTMLSAQAFLNYETRLWSATLDYRRGTMGGGGYLTGEQIDQVSGSFSREFDRKLICEAVIGYRRNTELGTQRKISGAFGGVQSSWRLGRYMSIFANYTVTNQSSDNSVPTNVLSDVLHVVSFGFTYSRDTNLSH